MKDFLASRKAHRALRKGANHIKATEKLSLSKYFLEIECLILFLAIYFSINYSPTNYSVGIDSISDIDIECSQASSCWATSHLTLHAV